jgi:uncharacterized protein YndB with AHSA1/START domain
MIEPLRMELTVECSVEHAFETWASETSRWWPSDHTVTGERGLTVTFEGRTGGRIFERTSSGAEHDWGEVLVWNPPHRLTYLWHIGRDRGHATEVDISFARVAEATAIVIEHRGWERLGAAGAEMRERNRRGWSGLLPHFTRATSGSSA